MPVSSARVGHPRITFTVIAALIFAIMPLPDSMAAARPELLLLLVIYWSLSAPRIAGLTFAWLCGFAIDMLTGVVLGQHALAFLTVGFLTHKFQLRMRVFPIWHQTFTVLMLLALNQFLLFWIDGVIGEPVTTWARWTPVLTGALSWPLLVTVLDTWTRRRR